MNFEDHWEHRPRPGLPHVRPRERQDFLHRTRWWRAPRRARRRFYRQV